MAIGWVLAQGPDIVTVVGARSWGRLTEALGALDLKLSDVDLGEIERAVPKGAAAGEKYPPAVAALIRRAD